tara:strand:- start:1920 stop:2141 length:222 start_codon:yes stop_codon:yes gene_type:complete
MSREDLNNFIHSVEHSSSLRRELKRCNNDKVKLLLLAKKYGFHITDQDLQEDIQAEKTNKWFKLSQIYPSKKF